MWRRRLIALLVLLAGVGIGWFVYTSQVHGWRPFKLGLDLSGGTQLVYGADTGKLEKSQIASALASLQGVIEKRINAFGVGEPNVQSQQGGTLGAGDYRLIVELPGVTDVNKAIAAIGKTPLLEFKLIKPDFKGKTVDDNGNPIPEAYQDTGLTGAYLASAQLQFGNGSSRASQEAVVVVNFNSQGAKLFSDITSNNVGQRLAIFLDGQVISAPVIQEKITDGTAVVSGNFTPQSAKELASNLNLGALPVPIKLLSTQTIGATLGDMALRAGLFAGIVGFLALSIFMIVWYRVPGIISVAALVMYIVIMLAIFKLIPVVLTAAGIAAFILSVGLAVDANILIAERMKEELAKGSGTDEAIREGFSRAWLAIRDSNVAHIIASIILFWLGTSIIKGFALVFGFGVIVSLFSAITISRTFLLALGLDMGRPVGRFLMRSGVSAHGRSASGGN